MMKKRYKKSMLKDTDHEEEGKGDAKMTDAGRCYQFPNLDNVPPVDNEVISMMNFKVRHEEPSTQTPSFLTIPVMVIPKTSTAAAPTIPMIISLITPLPQQSTLTPTPVPTTETTTTSILALPYFSSLFEFDQRVSVLEKELSQLKQVDYFAQLLKTIKSQIPAMVDDQLSTRLEDSIQKAFWSYTSEFEKKAQGEKKRYIDLVEKSVKDIIKDEVKSQLPHILPKEVSDYATPVIQSTITESLENVILAKSFSQPKSSYEAAASLTEFKLKKIILDKMQKSKLYLGAQEHKELYDRLVKSYKLDKDLFESYGKAYSLKRDREDKDKDEDPPAISDHGLKRRKTSMDAEPSKGSKSKESKSRSSKGTKTQPKLSGSDLGKTDDQPNVEAASERDWFKKPERPLTPDSNWNARKSIDFRPPQTWISKIAQAEKSPLTFDELISMPIVFSTYVMNNLKIDNLTQENLVRPAFNLFKGTCKSRVELEYHFEEWYKAVIDRLDWNNPEGQEYPFDLRKPLLLIEDRGIKDMVPSLWSLVKVAYDKYDVWGITDWGPKRQRFYGYKISNLERDVIFDLNVALRMFTRHVVILKRVEDLQLGVKSYQKKLNITKSDTFRSDISKRTTYTAYKNPQGIIYVDTFKRNRLMRLDELYKFSDGTLTSVRNALHDIASNPRMDYLPKRRWSNLNKQRSRIMIKAIDKLHLKRRLMRKLEKFVGGREYEEDFRLLERTT
ncbi:hypothetical protein Tco_1226637 [Tanacetum coccineum]